MALPLHGVRVHLSGAVPDDATDAARVGIHNFVQRFAAMVFRDGGTILHGSHPTLLAPLQRAAETYLSSQGRKDALILARPHSFASTSAQLAEIEAQRGYAAVQLVSDTESSGGQLVSMRDWLTERADSVVSVGGRWYDVNPAGAVAELQAGLEYGLPCFLVGGFGGAVQDFARSEPHVLNRLRNGWSPGVNRAVVESQDSFGLAQQINSQLGLLPIVKGSSKSGRLFRILTLDGGGLRGAFTAAVLAKWADMLRAQNSDSLIKHFDLVAGTSTGALLAIGLALGRTPKELLAFYREHGDRLFPGHRAIRHWLRSKHDASVLRELLCDIFGESRLSEDSSVRLVIPTVRAHNGHPEVIVTAHAPHRTGFRHVTAIDAALASSAAPTYFDEAVVSDDALGVHQYPDGGVWANNPILPALAEAVSGLGIPMERIDVLSVGTLSHESDFSACFGAGKVGWAKDSADLFFAAQENAALSLGNRFLGSSRVLRVNQQLSRGIALDDTVVLEDMIRRGSEVAMDTFDVARSRFFDGFHVPDWRQVGPA